MYNDDGFSGLKVKWEYCLGTTALSQQTNTAPKGTATGVMQATMSGYQDSDDGMLLVTVCEDGVLKYHECAYMMASTSISMELIPGAYNNPLSVGICSFDYEVLGSGATLE